MITDSLLGTFEMTIDEFKKKGSKQLHPEVFADISIRMRHFDLGCTFLVYGFDDDAQPHIFTVRNPGHTESFDKPGFWQLAQGHHHGVQGQVLAITIHIKKARDSLSLLK